MRAAEGNFALAAEAIGCGEPSLRNYVGRDPQLAAIWMPTAPDQIGETEVMTRTDDDLDLPFQGRQSKEQLGEAILRADREIMRRGLEGAGISPEIVKKLGLFEDMAMNTGRFLGAALDITHRLTVYQGVALFEQAEFIRKTYLEDGTLDMGMKIEWQKAYNEIAELIGKTSDRVLAGTTAAVAMLQRKDKEGGDGEGKEKVVGFQPLKPKK